MAYQKKEIFGIIEIYHTHHIGVTFAFYLFINELVPYLWVVIYPTNIK